MSLIILPFPLIILQLFILLICISLEAIVLQKKLKLTRKQSIQFSISINLLSTIMLWFIFFAFQAWAPENEKLHIISLILFNNLYNVQQWIGVYPILTIIVIIMFAIIVFIEFQSLQLFQAFLQIFSEQNHQNSQGSIPLINRINMVIMQLDSRIISTVFQANLLSNIIILPLIILLNVSGVR